MSQFEERHVERKEIWKRWSTGLKGCLWFKEKKVV
jgi:hypothetical protein